MKVVKIAVETNQDNASRGFGREPHSPPFSGGKNAESLTSSVKINSSKKKAPKTAKKPESKPEEKAGALEASNTGVSFISAPFTVSQRRHHGTNFDGTYAPDYAQGDFYRFSPVLPS